MLLTKLSTDIIVLVPTYLHSTDDLYSVVSTCRTLYSACNDSHVKLKPDLRRRDGQYLFQPHPHLLIASTARQVGDWAVLSSENRGAFHSAVQNNVPGLAQLCVCVARMSLTDMRRLDEIKYSILNPLCKILDGQAPKIGNFIDAEDDDPEEPEGENANAAMEYWTQLEHPDLCILNIWIYSDLFRHSILATYQHVNVPVPLSDEIRYDYVKFCIPDENAMSLDLSTNIVQYSGSLIQERSELCFQQLDIQQLRDTSFNLLCIRNHLFLAPVPPLLIPLDSYFHEVGQVSVITKRNVDMWSRREGR